MRVLHISAANELSGAGRATLITHNSLLESGIESRILFLKSELIGANIYSYNKGSLKERFKRYFISFLERIPLKFYPKRTSVTFSTGCVGISLCKHPLIMWADIINIHWANHGFIDIKEIDKWEKPIVWTLRDMWAFTGGCHHAFDCKGYLKDCGYCPELKSKCEKDLSYLGSYYKVKYLSSKKIHWVAISNWMKERATESKILRGKEISIIFSGVNSKDFKLMNKQQVRLSYGIPPTKKVILIGATNIRERYKGFDYMKTLLNSIDKSYLVLTFGYNTFLDNEIPQDFIHYGHLNNKKLNELYCVSDVFLAPSIAEAMGKTFLEAQLCGLPVICFEQTGPTDIIKHLETGYIAKFKNNEDLINGLHYCLNRKWDANIIRIKSAELFDIKVITNEYIKLYSKCLSESSDN